MDLTQAAITTIMELQSLTEKPIDLDGRTYINRSMVEVRPEPDPVAAPLTIHTLSGLKALLATADSDEDAPTFYMVHVRSEVEVAIVSAIFGPGRQRECLAVCAPVLKSFRFDAFMEVEEFVIAGQALFDDVADRAVVLKIAGTVRDENVRQTADNGISQTLVEDIIREWMRER